MSQNLVLTQREGGVATVTVNRPDVLNALDAATVSGLTSVMSELRDDDGVRAVVLTGAGERAFVAGADINELSKLDPLTARTLAERGHYLCGLIECLGKPVIAAINGFALGGGCELALACTLRIASATAKLGQPEIGLGIIPGFGGTQRLPRLVGSGRALELLLTGAPIGAEEAWRIGLVNRVVGPEALKEVAHQLASTIAQQAPIAIRAILDAVRHGSSMSLPDGLAFEASTFGVINGTADAREGTMAFLEKRQPQFTGR